MAFIAGISFSDILLVVVSNLFTGLFAALHAHKKTLAIVASCALILIGVYYLFFKKAKVNTEGEAEFVFRTRDYVKIFIMGFLINLFNPGIIIFWITTATTFIGETLQNRVVIFSAALFIALVADIIKVVLADKIRRKLTLHNIHRINQINGGILIAFGIGIIFLQ